MPTYAYDIECLSNLFTATFVNVEDEGDKHVFCIGLEHRDFMGLATFLKQRMTLVGYNNHSYDDPMLRYLMKYSGTMLNRDLHSLSNKLVNDSFRGDKELLKLRYPREKFNWDSVDLMRILAFDKLGISLKQTAINLKWHKIQDMPISHEATVTEDQVDLILSYNLNDVLITKKLYEELTPIRALREELSKLYHVDLRSASDSRMANLILEDIYANELNMDIRSIRDMRTERSKVLLKNCIASFVEFKTPILRQLLERMCVTYVYNYKGFKYSEALNFAGCKFALGIGGLHTEDEAGIFESDDEFLIQDMDVASYYPNLIINNNFYPEHLGEGFIKVLKKITEERIHAKKSGDKVKAQGMKITINSIFGKLGSPTFWLMDAKQMLSTTVSGQLGLLMLVEELDLNGIPVISCNTDGVVCKIPRKLLPKYYEIADWWMKKTNLELEFTPYLKYVRRDVNSYITVKEDGETKEKGAFVKKVDLKKAYHMPIVAKALHAYFVEGKPIKETLEECKDIMDFCISQKSGSDFVIELHTTKGIEKLQKTNRFFITKKGGSLIKRRSSGTGQIGLHVGRMVRILNDYDASVPFEDYAVDLAFYEKEVMKIVDEIEPKQLSLFDMGELRQGTKTKMEMPKLHKEEVVEEEEQDTDVSASELSGLGKNQLLKRLEDIIANRQKITNLNPRYVYILDFDEKEMIATIYCLGKAVIQAIDVDKTAYAENNIKVGQILYCHKFMKVGTTNFLAGYKIVDKLEIEEDSFSW